MTNEIYIYPKKISTRKTDFSAQKSQFSNKIHPKLKNNN